MSALNENGVLILSEFAGAAGQLHTNALLVNPNLENLRQTNDEGSWQADKEHLDDLLDDIDDHLRNAMAYFAG